MPKITIYCLRRAKSSFCCTISYGIIFATLSALQKAGLAASFTVWAEPVSQL
jgi:hypothetical protein